MVEGAGNAGAMGVAGEQSNDTVCRSPVQGTIMKKRKERMIESVDRAIRLKCENQFDWWRAYGDKPVGTRNVIKRLGEIKRLLK